MAVLESMLAVGLATVGAVDVRLEPTKLSYRINEAVAVRVLVQNPRESVAPLFVEPSFWLLPEAPTEEGQTTLLIDVVGPDGLWIQPRRPVAPTIVVREKVGPCSFVRLLPGQSLGQEVVINEPTRGVPMARVGTYRVSVTVEGHGRRLARRLAEEPTVSISTLHAGAAV